MNKITPQCFKASSKPSSFCAGCGHSLLLKTLGFTVDDLKIQDKTVLATDIGCSLLAWDYFDIDTIQAHHGRATSTAVGLKKALPKSIILAYMGDGGGYSIGLHHLIHAAKRNEPLTVILVNNTVFAMTGGQKAPTTVIGEETESSPGGKFTEDGPIFGPELLKEIQPKAFLARTSVDNLPQLKNYLEKAINHQMTNNSFAFVEVLSWCPVNWKMDMRSCSNFLQKLKKIYPLGVINE